MKLMELLKKWINKEPTKSELYILVFLILVLGKVVLPWTLEVFTPAYLGIRGVEITNEQAMNMSKEFADTLVTNYVKTNHNFFQMSESMFGWLLRIWMELLPWLVLISYIVTFLCLFRIAIRFIANKFKKNKNVKEAV